MKISDIITPDRIACSVEVTSKKAALEKLSELLASSHVTLTTTEIFEGLIAREKLGSTGIGHGVAIPHGRSAKLNACVGAFIQLRESIEFDAIDNEPVDLLFALLVPEESTEAHLQILSLLAERFASETFVNKLRTSGERQAVYKFLTES